MKFLPPSRAIAHFGSANFPVAYQGLKIITSLSLRFPDFQRLPDKQLPDLAEIDKSIGECIPDVLLRTDSILQHPVFHLYQSETEMMRYMRLLANKDIALDRSMIPLGSCTMKLNSATSLQAISQYEFNSLHPFIPTYQAQGYQQLFEELENMLCDLTGFDAFSLQPNAGSQGEYSGLLVIQKYHQSRGDTQRNICLIPESAHGTNPASAALAGLNIINLPCDQAGNINLGFPSKAGQKLTLSQ